MQSGSRCAGNGGGQASRPASSGGCMARCCKSGLRRSPGPYWVAALWLLALSMPHAHAVDYLPLELPCLAVKTESAIEAEARACGSRRLWLEGLRAIWEPLGDRPQANELSAFQLEATRLPRKAVLLVAHRDGRSRILGASAEGFLPVEGD